MKEKASILIVDDNVSLFKAMSFVLERKGYSVTTAKDGDEAIEKIKNKPFDIIFMDIKMPIMDNVETYKMVKKIRPESVVLMMAAYTVDNLIQEALEEGAYGIVYRSRDIDRTVALIERVSEAKRGAFILVVDDDQGIDITLRDILSKRGYQVNVAHKGEDAITVAREKTKSIISIEARLPTINGLEIYLAIREANPEAVAIMMTANHQELIELVEDALDDHTYTCLDKPFDMAEVLKLVDGIQERKQQAG